MSTGQKQNYISLVTTLLVSVPYFIFIFNKYQLEVLNISGELRFWSTAILLLIPIRIVSEIVISIAGAVLQAIITGKEGKDLSDERDTLIELKSTRNAYFIFMFSFMAAILAVSQGHSVSVMFSILIISGFLSELFEIFSKIYYYKKGF